MILVSRNIMFVLCEYSQGFSIDSVVLENGDAQTFPL